MAKKYFIAGGAGFIGSNLVTRLLDEEKGSLVTVYDNFSSGRQWHLDACAGNKDLTVVKGDIKDKENLSKAIKGSDIVYHFASNPDISKAMTQPDIDFWEGTYLTNNIIEAMRENGVRRLLYASGSGIYGDTGLHETNEDHSPLLPISTYGSSKLSCEAMICSYCHMFSMEATAFRFANVVGPNQTHGVGYDFVRSLLRNSAELKILGDGKQSKSYIYFTDVIDAMRLIEKNPPGDFSYYNVSTKDHITVNDIAQMAMEVTGVKGARLAYTGGDRGWKGDVPVVRLNSEKIRMLGWKNRLSSQEAMRKSIEGIYNNTKAGMFETNKEAR
jgi:UDP-glucose 4-epimerase